MINSRKFKAMIFDAIISALTYMVTWYIAPDMAEKILTLIGLMQPVVLSYILGVAIEDGAAKRAGFLPKPPNSDQ